MFQNSDLLTLVRDGWRLQGRASRWTEKQRDRPSIGARSDGLTHRHVDAMCSSHAVVRLPRSRVSRCRVRGGTVRNWLTKQRSAFVFREAPRRDGSICRFGHETVRRTAQRTHVTTTRMAVLAASATLPKPCEMSGKTGLAKRLGEVIPATREVTQPSAE